MEVKFSKENLVLFPTLELKTNPKNRNKHPKEQIDRLVSLLKYQGFRQPIVVSNQSGLVVVGHGRLEAAKKLKITHVPVLFQNFDNEEQEYAFGVSDNAIASWAELDLGGINFDLPELGPEFDLDLLGLKNFNMDFEVHEEAPKKPPEMKVVECPNCGETFEAKQARIKEI